MKRIEQSLINGRLNLEMSTEISTIDIRPTASVYATYRRLSYKPWYAIAEFVDNSTQNYYDHKEQLKLAYRSDHIVRRMRVEIIYDDERRSLTITDNANGMEIDELKRAIALDRPPENKNGRCEFGMGLKTASCWFGTTWTILTSRLGSSRELKSTRHVPDLVENHTESISVQENPVDPSCHYTKIIIEGLYKLIRGRTVARIHDQLGSMYREDLRSNEIEIYWNGIPLSFEEPPILVEDLGDGTSTTWKKNISIEVPWDTEATRLKSIGMGWITYAWKSKGCRTCLVQKG